jgi:hypothetical protein
MATLFTQSQLRAIADALGDTDLHPIRDEAIRSRPVRSLAACGKLQAARGSSLSSAPALQPTTNSQIRAVNES